MFDKPNVPEDCAAEDVRAALVFHTSALRQPRFGEWIRERRRQAGLTLRDAALASGVAAGTWSDVESGRDLRLSTMTLMIDWAVTMRPE